MAYVVFLVCRERGCMAAPTRRVMTTMGEIVGDYCHKHAGAEFARQDAREKAARKEVGPGA